MGKSSWIFFGIGTAIFICREMLFLPYAGFFKDKYATTYLPIYLTVVTVVAVVTVVTVGTVVTKIMQLLHKKTPQPLKEKYIFF